MLLSSLPRDFPLAGVWCNGKWWFHIISGWRCCLKLCRCEWHQNMEQTRNMCRSCRFSIRLHLRLSKTYSTYPVAHSHVTFLMLHTSPSTANSMYVHMIYSRFHRWCHCASYVAKQKGACSLLQDNLNGQMHSYRIHVEVLRMSHDQLTGFQYLCQISI